MRRRSMLVVCAMLVVLAGCNKSSPPPQKPLTPRTAAIADVTLLPAR